MHPKRLFLISAILAALTLSYAFTPSAAEGVLKNQLATASSPYLREAAAQPVAWYPWGEEPFRLAKELLKTFAGAAPEAGRFASTYALAVDLHFHPPAHAVIIGPPSDPRTRALWQAALKASSPLPPSGTRPQSPAAPASSR